MSRSVTSPKPRSAYSFSAALRIAVLVWSDAIFIGPMREMPGRCNLNNCMKLSFEAGECQCADGAMALRQTGLEPQPQDLAARLVLRMTDGGETVPAIIPSSKMRGTLNGLQHVCPSARMAQS